MIDMLRSTARILPLFPTPVYSTILSDHATLDRELREAILARRTRHPGVAISNVGGWQSRNDMQIWGDPAVQRLASAVTAIADEITVGTGDVSKVVWQIEMWANVNEQGDSNQSHWHPGSYLSAVYYVDTGYAGSVDPALGGELVFVDPRMPYLHMRTPDLHHCAADGSTSGQETWVRPLPGLLVLFPSYLSHSVRSYRGPHRRISIAVNLLVSPQTA